MPIVLLLLQIKSLYYSSITKQYTKCRLSVYVKHLLTLCQVSVPSWYQISQYAWRQILSINWTVIINYHRAQIKWGTNGFHLKGYVYCDDRPTLLLVSLANACKVTLSTYKHIYICICIYIYTITNSLGYLVIVTVHSFHLAKCHATILLIWNTTTTLAVWLCLVLVNWSEPQPHRCTLI